MTVPEQYRIQTSQIFLYVQGVELNGKIAKYRYRMKKTKVFGGNKPNKHLEKKELIMTHLSLFSGIGGLDLAAEWAGIQTVGQCEWAEYPTKVLEKHWPDVPRWKDIRTLTGESFYERTGRRTVDIISGGFPCQPFSVAGKQRGKEDDRYLWPEMVRVIKELRPTWVVGENVAGIIKMALSDILYELEACGYRTRTFLIPACAVGARHRRYRVAIVGYSEYNGLSSAAVTGGTQKTGRGQQEGKKKPANLREQVNPETVKMWPTPTRNGNYNRPGVSKTSGMGLASAVKLWPTPKASLRGDCPSERNRRSPDLSAAVKMYNTPTAQDAKNSTLPQSQIKRDSLVGDVMREMFATPQARDYRTGQKSRWEDKEHRSRNLNDQCGEQLNPYWVEWLMGFPPGWTEI